MLYHLGVRRVARSSLARVNEKQPSGLYEALFGRLLARCRTTAPGHGFRFHNKLFSLDATYVDLCLELFPWAQYRETKGALKLHVGLDHEGCLPAFLEVTDGKGSDLEVARSLRLPRGSIVAADRLYLDFEWQLLRVSSISWRRLERSFPRHCLNFGTTSCHLRRIAGIYTPSSLRALPRGFPTRPSSLFGVFAGLEASAGYSTGQTLSTRLLRPSLYWRPIGGYSGSIYTRRGRTDVRPRVDDWATGRRFD